MTLPDTGYRRSPVDHRDHNYRATMMPATVGRLPDRWRVDARSPLTPYDQDGPSCVGWMTAMLKTVQERQDKRRTIAFDGQAFYNRIALPGGGAYLRDALDLARTEGVPTADGRLLPIASYAAVNPRDHDAVRHAIKSNRGLCIGFAVTRQWAENGGQEFAPSDGEIVGHHGMFVSGWELQGPDGLNSWGARWSGDGRKLLPWDYWDRHVWEAWAVQDVDD